MSPGARRPIAKYSSPALRGEFLPLGDDGQGIGTVQRFHQGQRIADARVVAEDALRFMRGNRIVGADRCAARQQVGNQHQARRFAHVVGIGLEGQPPQGEGFAAEVLAEARDDLLCQHALLRVVGRLDRLQHLQRLAGILRRADQ
ncbi:MAG: hypothetical protein FD118_2027, partial [Rhodocyclaceae bacterium]